MSENEDNNKCPVITGTTLALGSLALSGLHGCAKQVMQIPSVEAAAETAPAPSAEKPAEAAALQREGGYTARLGNGMSLVVGNGGSRKVPLRADTHQETAALRRRANPGETKTPLF